MTLKASSFPTVRPTLDLNFAQSKTLDPRVTFSRSSSSTYFDGSGVMQSAATNVPRFDHNPSTGESLGLLVEEARTNGIPYSEHFDNSSWNPSNVSVARNVALAPDGTFTADRLVVTSTSGSLDTRYCFTRGSGTGGFTSTSSVFVKKDTARYFQLGYHNYGGYIAAAVFDLDQQTFTVSAHPFYGAISARIDVCLNNWLRLSFTVASDQGGNIYYFSSSNSNLVPTDGTSGVFLWGAQTEIGSFPTSYIPTPATWTGRASTATFFNSSGVLQTAASGVARSAAFFPDSNGVMRPAGLLLEAAATNAIFPSSPSSAGWAPSALSNFGPTTGITFNQANSLTGGNTAASFNSGSSQLNYQLGTVSSGSCLSFYIRNVSSSVTLGIVLPSTGGGSITISSSYTISLSSSGWLTNGRITNAGNGWYRVSVVINGSSGNSQMGFSGGNAGVLVDLFQLETGLVPTSYIATTSSAVTRAADTSTSATVTRSADVANITGTNLTSWFTRDTGTLLCIAKNFAENNPSTPIDFNTNSIFYQSAGGFRFGFTGFWSSVTQTGLDAWANGVPVSASTTNVNEPITASSTIRHAFAYSPTENRGCIKQTLGTVAGSGVHLAAQGVTDFRLSTSSSRVSRVTFWPTRLSDATLQAITR